METKGGARRLAAILVHCTARQYAEAVDALSRTTRPDHTHRALFAASLAQLGDRTAASAHAQEVLKQAPEFSIRRHLLTLHYRLDSDREHVRDGLQRTGLPA